VSPDPDARVEARLADAVERAAVVDRLTSQLSQAQDELRRAEGEVTRLRDLLAAGQDRIHRLGTRTWSRLVKFAQGTYDEDLRAERAELVAVRAGLSEATGDLEDAQRLVGDLTRRRAEFPEPRCSWPARCRTRRTCSEPAGTGGAGPRPSVAQPGARPAR